ncbi:MAG TPA: ABC transporter permease [Chloroflexi bacterium]|nr:ABC transporter permease [Chloroflexota bacterium]
MLPFSFKFEKRLEPSRLASILVPVLSLLLAFLFGAALLAVIGANPGQTYQAMLAGAIGTPAQWQDGQFYNMTELLVKAVPIILTGLSVSVAFRMLFWNIGAEGQLVMGGIATAAVALFFPSALPFIPESPWIYIPLMFVAAILAGAAWALIPALLKAYLKVNEIITTLMFNYIAILWYQFLFTTAWKDPEGFGFPGSALIPEYTWIPRISGRLHWGLLLAIAAAFVVWVIMDKTRWGYEIRLIGENARAANYAGVSIIRNIILVMILSGGLAGLAGFVEVTAISHRLQHGLAVGYGFTGIIVAWLAKLNPWGVVIVSILLSALLVGGEQIQITMGLPASVSLVLQGAILLFVLGGDVFTRYRLRMIRKAPTAVVAESPSVQEA